MYDIRYNIRCQCSGDSANLNSLMDTDAIRRWNLCRDRKVINCFQQRVFNAAHPVGEGRQELCHWSNGGMVSISVTRRAWRVLIGIITAIIFIHCATVVGINVCVRTGRGAHIRDRPCKSVSMCHNQYSTLYSILDFDIEVFGLRYRSHDFDIEEKTSI